MRQAGKIVAMMVVVALPLIVIPQYLYDPLGLWVWDDLHQISRRISCTSETCMQYAFPEGEFTYQSGWTVTTNEDGTRLTPDNVPTCDVRIALLGDSLTWGAFVNDSETWANRLATRFPAACFDNYGQWNYNAEQVAWTLEHQVTGHTDHVIYLIYTNDDVPRRTYPTSRPPPDPLMLFRYIDYVSWQLGGQSRQAGRGEPPPKDSAMFATAIQTIAADSRVHFAGFEQELLAYTVKEMGYEVYDVPVPPRFEAVSPVDGHPNARGYEGMARSLYPLVEGLLES